MPSCEAESRGGDAGSLAGAAFAAAAALAAGGDPICEALRDAALLFDAERLFRSDELFLSDDPCFSVARFDDDEDEEGIDELFRCGVATAGSERGVARGAGAYSGCT
jgi:hypothetical protein